MTKLRFNQLFRYYIQGVHTKASLVATLKEEGMPPEKVQHVLRAIEILRDVHGSLPA